MRLEYGPVRDDAEMRAFAEMIMQSLAGSIPTEPDWYERWKERWLVDIDVRVVRCDGALAGGLGLLRFGQWFGGKSVRCAGVTAVAIAPEHRGRGVASYLMRESIREVRSDGRPLAALYPATQTLYRKSGFELAGSYQSYQVPLHKITCVERELRVRPMVEGDRAIASSLYEARARRTNGHLDRNEWLWMRTLNPYKQRVFAYVVEGVEGGSGAEGYVAFLQRDEPTVRYELIVKDLVASTPRAHRALLAFLGSHRSMAAHFVFYGAPADPFLYLLDEASWTWGKQRIDWMLRLVDVSAALEQRGYPAGARGELHLEVVDELLQDNAGRIVLQVEGGEGRVRAGGRGDLRLDVRALASMYSGYLGARELLSASALTGEGEALALATTLFASSAPWMSDMF